MPPKTPRFWHSRNLISAALAPFSCLYQLGHSARSAMANPYKSRLPVLCVGGAVAGGSGKTPVVHAILSLIREHRIFERPVVLTRGYGGELAGPTTVDLDSHSVRHVGDEALLHATFAPTIVSRDRAAGARLAEAMGADIIILDDGLQNLSLVKDLSLLVFDARQGIGNGQVLPAGPLREPLESALKKCAAVIETSGRSERNFSVPVFSTNIEIVSAHDKNQEYFAFCGLGRPQKFFETLASHDFIISGIKEFSDHHPYTEQNIKDLIRESRGARLITTEKDFVRIPDSCKAMVDALTISLIFDKPEEVVSLLKSGLNS